MGFIEVNGIPYILNEDDDIVKLVDEQCGSELARIIEAKITSVDIDKRTTELRAQNDAESYLGSLERNHSLFEEVMDMSDDLLSHVNKSKRLSREYLSGALKTIISTIKEEL